MTLPPVGTPVTVPQPVVLLATRAVPPKPAGAIEITRDRVDFHVDATAPHTRIIIPGGPSLDRHPVSGSKSGRNIVAGAIVGGLGGGRLAMELMTVSPVAAATVALGGAVVGGVLGWFLTQKKPVPPTQAPPVQAPPAPAQPPQTPPTQV